MRSGRQTFRTPRRISLKALLASAVVSLGALAIIATELTNMRLPDTLSGQALASDMVALPQSPAFQAQPVRRCINVANALEVPPGEDWGYTIRAEDFSQISAAGFDTIRLPVKWSAYTGPAPDYRIDPAFLAKVDAHVNEATQRGLQVILNVHHFDEFSRRPRREEARLRAIWAQLSRHFRGRSNALIFELINEPHFEDVEGVGDEDYSQPIGIARMNRINRELTAMIRAQHPDRWIVLGSSQWGNPYPMFEGVDGVRFAPDPDPRVITTFHFYEPIAFTHQAMEFSGHPPYPRRWGTSRDRQEIADVFAEVARFRAQGGHNMPVLLGEFGTSTQTPPAQRQAYAQHIRSLSEYYAMGWCTFDFASPTFGMFDTRQNRWDAALLGTLIDPSGRQPQ